MLRYPFCSMVLAISWTSPNTLAGEHQRIYQSIIQPDHDIALVSRTTGFVDKVPILGKRYKKGEIVFFIKDTRLSSRMRKLESEIRAKKASLTYLEAKFESDKKNQFTSALNLIRAESNLQAARSELEALEFLLEAEEIKHKEQSIVAPTEGLINERSVNFGQFVMRGDTIGNYVSTLRLKAAVELDLSEGLERSMITVCKSNFCTKPMTIELYPLQTGRYRLDVYLEPSNFNIGERVQISTQRSST